VSPPPLFATGVVCPRELPRNWCVPTALTLDPWPRGMGVAAARQRRMPPVGGPCERAR
jgi:hypothetical protein